MPKYSFNTQAFTLIELVMTMAIAGILVTIAIPSFNSIITSSRLTSYANDLVGALNLARSEAVRRGVQVIVSNNMNTGLTHWESGWTVCVETDGDQQCKPPDNLCTTSAIGVPTEDCILKIYPPLVNGYTITTGNSFQKAASYFPNGFIGVAGISFGDTFRLCNGSDITTSRTVVVDNVGRARVTSVGTASSCP